MRRKTTCHDQRRLPLSREERLGLLDNRDLEKLGVATRQWRSVRELLRQIEYCGGADSSYARVETLAARMGCSKRTAQRARRAAEGAGLLRVAERYTSTGQRTNQWLVAWDRLAAASLEVSPPGGVVTPPRVIASPPGDVVSPPIEIHQSSIRDPLEMVDRRDDQKNMEVDWQRAERDAARLERRVGPCRSDQDRDLAIKAAALSQRYGERWLWDAAEACRVVRPERPWAYFWSCIADGARKQQRRLTRDLARLRPPVAAAGVDLSERLCAAGGRE